MKKIIAFLKLFMEKLNKISQFKFSILTFFLIISFFFFIVILFEEFSFWNIHVDKKIKIIDGFKNYFQITFFLIMSLVAVLSYKQAKKTLFNPIRTEIFKIQVKEYQELVEFFRKSSFNEEFDYQKIVHINSIKMVDAYAETFFSDEIDINKLKESRKDLFKDIFGGIISQKNASNYLERIDYETKLKKIDTDEEKINSPALLLKKWDNYVHAMVDFTSKYQEKTEHINIISSSPLLPAKLVVFINNFIEKRDANLLILSDLLTEKSKEFPIKYPSVTSLKNINMAGFWNDFNHNKNDLKKESEDILIFINSYLKIDKII